MKNYSIGNYRVVFTSGTYVQCLYFEHVTIRESVVDFGCPFSVVEILKDNEVIAYFFPQNDFKIEKLL